MLLDRLRVLRQHGREGPHGRFLDAVLALQVQALQEQRDELAELFGHDVEGQPAQHAGERDQVVWFHILVGVAEGGGDAGDQEVEGFLLV